MLIAQAKLTPLIVETSGAALRLPPSAVTVASWGLDRRASEGSGDYGQAIVEQGGAAGAA